MIAIADILQAGEKLTAVAPFLAGIQKMPLNCGTFA